MVVRQAVAVALLGSSVMPAADPGDDAAMKSAVDAMIAEPLLTTSPQSLRMTNYLLTRAFNGGIDDLDSYAYLLKLVIGHALALAERDPDEAKAYKTAAIPMTFNLAVNTWIGWGPGGIGEVADRHRRLGLEAARKNIELAAEVGLGPERRQRGYWALGAHLIAAGDLEGAAEAFATCRDLGRKAGKEDVALMAQGWIHAASILGGKDEDGELAAVKEKLRAAGDDGAFYADQYDVALAVFGAQVPKR